MPNPTRPAPESDTPRATPPDDPWTIYHQRRDAWKAAMQVWRDGGEVGPPPPMPVRPHTPGFYVPPKDGPDD